MNHPGSFVLAAAVGVAVSIGAQAHAQNAAPSVDPRADQLLRAMSDRLARLRTFEVSTSHSTEVVTRDGQKIAVVGESRVAVQRPNMLRSERLGGRSDAVLFYDGRNLTLWGKRRQLYATTAAPPRLDRMIDFARDQLDVDAPAADLLYTSSYNVLMEDVVSGTYLGKEPIGNRMCHHLAYRGNETDWQIWIQDGPDPLPCRYEITSKRVTGEPEFIVTMRNWKLDPTFPPGYFQFTPPAGATRIDFMAVRRARQQVGAR